jgi:hypothetical protein
MNAGRNPPPIDEGLVINTRAIQQERERTDEKRKDEEYRRRQLLFNGLTVLFTLCLVVANVVYDGLTLEVARQAKTSAEAAKSAAETAKETLKSYDQSFKQEQRAYLWASSFNMSNPPICAFGGSRVCAGRPYRQQRQNACSWGSYTPLRGVWTRRYTNSQRIDCSEIHQSFRRHPWNYDGKMGHGGYRHHRRRHSPRAD